MSSHYRNIASTIRGGVVCAALLSAGTSLSAHGALIGPDTFGYQADTAATFTYEDISATGEVAIPDGEDAYAAAVIGFTFPFYGEDHRTLFVSTEGMVTFEVPNIRGDNASLATAIPYLLPAVIAPLWDDWSLLDQADAIYTQTLGTAGQDLRFIVQWHAVERYNADIYTGTVDFQLVLFENGDMEFRYLDVDGLSFDIANIGGSSTIGIRNTQPDAPANGHVLQIAHDTAGSVVNGQAIRITNISNRAPVCDVATPSAAQVNANDAHSLVPITVTGVTDPDADAVRVTVDSIYQDEGVLERSSGKTCPDGGGLGTSTGLIRAERVGDKKVPGNGRVYTLGFTATDSQGASCIGTVKVCVPRIVSGHRECVEDNVVVDSTTCR